MKVILGSASKRRQDLMDLLKIPYEVLVSDEDEVYDKNKNLYEQCINISEHKALNVFNKTSGNRIVIGSDTVVIFENQIYGKPKNKDEAFKMLKKLSGKCHEVVTSVCFMVYKNNQIIKESDYKITKVYIDELSDSEILHWINNNDVCNLAGGYAIQGEFGKFVNKIEGDYYTVVGFPLNKVYRKLEKYLN